jgi:Arc/MetJ-type ribon-helix-helix transcriptional regulator
LSESEQIRQGIRWWLESREWPSRTPERDEAAGKARAAPRGARKRS